MTRRDTIGRAARGAFLLALAVLLPGCGSFRRPPPEIDRSQDSRIRAEVEARLRAEPEIDASAIRVAVDGGVVVLHGAVRGLASWQCAIRNAELVEGVRSVAERLILEKGPREIRCLAPETGAADPPPLP